MDVCRLLRAASVASALTVAAACAQDTGGGEGVGTGATATADALADLTVAYQADADAGTGDETFTLRCAADGTAIEADHPAPDEACGGLATADQPFAEVPEDSACTMIFGGPDAAAVTGTYRGEPVDTTFTLRNGCEIARWQEAAVLAGIGPDPADIPGG